MGLYSLASNPVPPATTGTNTLFAIANSVTPLVVADASRLALTLQNLGNKTVYVGFSNAVSLTNYAIALLANTAYEFPTPYTGALFAISASGTQSVNAIEMS